MNSFHSAAFVMGLGAPQSLPVRRALKVALMLTDTDGAGYAPDNTELAFSVSDRERLSTRIERLAQKSATKPFETLCVYLAAELHEADGWYVRAPGSERPDDRILLESLEKSLELIDSNSMLLMLDFSSDAGMSNGRLPDELVTHLMDGMSAKRANVALVAAVGDGAEPATPRSRPLAHPCLNSFVLEWLAGRNTSLDDTLNLSSLRTFLAAHDSLKVELHVAGDESAIRVGQRFPWLEWNKRTTMPGHAVPSLQHLVDGNASVLVERVLQQPLSAATLAGLPNSLFASIWREALQLERPRGHMEKLDRDRGIITEALQENNSNRTATADALGISRSTLYAKMRRLNIH